MSKKKWLIIGGIVLAVAIIATITTIALVRYYSMRGTCGNNLTWVYDGKGTLTISGTGKMEYEVVPEWYNYLREIDTVIIEEGVQNIAPYAFSLHDGSRKNNDSLKEVYIADTVTLIGANAFSGCTNLIEIHLPDNIQTISSSAFSECSSLGHVTLPKTLTVINYSAFRGCSNLTDVIFPETLEIIEDSSFEGCTSLNIINIPESVKTIGSYAFANCSNLSEIHFQGFFPFEETTEDVFKNVSATAYIPSYLWDGCYVENLGGNIDWRN